MASKFGGAPRHSDAYANHPPLIVAETVVAELVAGEHRIVTRSPAWVGSLVALALVAWLLVDAGLSRLATVSGVAVAFGSAMFLVYGSMLDTPVTSVPFALALLVAWQRAARIAPGIRPSRQALRPRRPRRMAETACSWRAGRSP
ncbi:MAG: hypothetical protein R2746_07890 [Acidimicrobiales bacterium]